MPYVALAPATRETRDDAAADRWAALLSVRPDLAPAIALQRQLLGLVSDLTESIDHRPLPRLSLPPRYLAAKLQRGVPTLAEVAHSDRVLRCSFCALAWAPNEYGCVYCHEHGEKFVTAAPNEDRKDRRLEICGACGSYLKTIDVLALTPFPLLAISDLETMDLDMAAMERGYGRPALKDFGRK